MSSPIETVMLYLVAKVLKTKVGVGLQIWDFHLGRLRVHEEEPEVAFGANDAGFTIKNFGELMREASLTNTKMLRDVYHINCMSAHDDMATNVSPTSSPFLFYYFVFNKPKHNLHSLPDNKID